MGNPQIPEPQSPSAATEGTIVTSDPVPWPPLWLLLGRLSLQRQLDGCGAKTNVQGKRGPAGPRYGAAVAASEHRNGAHPRRLQLAGHREGSEQRHEPGLLDWPTAAADGYRDAGLRPGFAAAGVDVHEHLADRAAEGGGGHGWMARNTDPTPRRRGRARAAQRLASALARPWWWRHCWVRGSPGPWLDPGDAVACWGADLGGLLAEPRA
jgi:hypothetical protein